MFVPGKGEHLKPTNIRPGWKDLPVTYDLAYLASLLVRKDNVYVRYQFFSFVTQTNRQNKLDRLSLASLSTTKGEHLKPKNIRPGWKGLSMTNALAYLASLLVTKNNVYVRYHFFPSSHRRIVKIS
jgi:hypothetical protein